MNIIVFDLTQMPTALLHSPLSARQPFITVKPRSVNVLMSADIALPDDTSVILSPRDDAAEYDDSGDSHSFQDNPKYGYII